MYSHFWRKPLRETLDLFDRALQSAHDCGNNEFVAYVTHGWSKHAFYASIELARVEERCLRLRAFLDGIQYVTQSRWINIYVTAVQALRGSSSARGITWRGTPFDDDRDLPDLQRVEDQLGLLYAYCAKAWVATLFGDHDGVEEYSDLAYSFLVAAPAGLEKAMLTFISGLRRARELRVTPESSESEQALQEQLDLLERFAGLAPMNFAHKLALVQAEVHRARGEVVQAMQAYEEASQGALENGYLAEAGLAHALAAEFHRELGVQHAALHHAEQATRAWRSWGAEALVEHLLQGWPDLIRRGDRTSPSGSSPGLSRTTVDLASVTRAASAIASELHQDKLLMAMMTAVLEYAGGRRGLFLIERDGVWRPVVTARSGPSGIEAALVGPEQAHEHHVPEPMVRAAARSGELVLCDDVSADPQWSESFEGRAARSVLVKPVVGGGQVRGVLVLENELLAGAFRQDHLEALDLLAAQTAVSLDNARLYGRLEEKVAQRTAELLEAKESAEEAKESAEEANRAKSAFLANMSHELRTPLNAILGFSQMLSLDPRVDPKQRESIDIINRSGTHLLRMIDDVLSLSRIESGRTELSEEPFEPSRMIGEIASMMKPHVERAGLGFEVSLTGLDGVGLVGDASKLRQVLLNLLNNAVRFTAEGEVRLRARSLEAGEGGRVLELEVEDTGRGIPEDELDDVFTRFAQAGDSAAGAERGVGLGLAIAKSIVERMGGTITVESTLGQGTVFRVSVPMREAEVVPDTPVALVVGLEEGQPDWRVLVVDDNLENRLLLVRLLEEVGFDVGQAKEGASAIAQFEQWRPHLILMDMRMSEVDGFAATRRIRELPGGGDVKIAAVTASVLSEQREEILASGCDELIRKPVRRQSLFEVIGELLGARFRYEAPPSAPESEGALTPAMLSGIPGELLAELGEATLLLNRSAMSEVVTRIAEHAPEAAAMLQRMIEQLQLGRVRDLLADLGPGDDAP